MSLIQLSSEGSQNNLLNNFTCYFNRGLKIAPYSKIGLVSASLMNNGNATVVVNELNNDFYMRFGLNPYLNNTIDIKIPVGEYTTNSLIQYIELEIARKQNYLPFKKLTKLDLNTMSDEFLQFGTSITGVVADSGILSKITFHNYQLPSSNTGNVVLTGSTKLMTSYKKGPSKANFEDVFWNDILSDVAPNEIFNSVQENNGATAMEVIAQNLAQHPRTGINNVIVPIIVREWISYNNSAPFTFFVPRPTTGNSWSNHNDRVVGLISLGDIVREDNEDGLIDGRHYIQGRAYGNFGVKIGIQFEVAGLAHGRIKVFALEKEAGLLPKNVILESYTLPNSNESGYYVAIHLDVNGFGDMEFGEASITVSPNADLSNPVISTIINSKKTFLGTKAYPLVPIIYNGTKESSDVAGSRTDIMYNATAGEELFTHAYIQNDSIYDADSGTNAIPFDPQNEYKIVETAESSIVYAAAATGTVDVPQLDFTGSTFAYMNAEEGLKTSASTVNELITPNFQRTQEQLHPRLSYLKANFGGVIGLNDNVYKFDDDDDAVIKGSIKFVRDNLEINDLAGNPSYHIQINNLPVKSLNSINHSINSTIAVIPKVSITNRQTSVEPSEVQFLEINNKEEISINELSVRITETDNTLTKDLGGTVELICMIKK